MSPRGTSGRNAVVITIIGVVLAGAAWLYFLHREPTPSPAKPLSSTPVAASSATPAIRHPIGEAATESPAAASTAALPALDASDAAVADALSAIPGAAGLRDLLVVQGLLPHVVATVDALPRRTIGSSILPLRTPSGAFAVADKNGVIAAVPANQDRYAPYLRIAEAVDTRALVGWYVHWYPLFQQAYQELGYPNGYFNDRLIAAIDDMLAAPEPRSPPALLPATHGRYAFADPALESLSVGQKLMIRLGPQNEARLKAKLREVRAALVGKLPRAVPSGTSAAAAGAR
ncbi:MAG: DUF3014 domain-containing protein [Proteobacteria bacterium]|nr:DUF3014 domain-containing protein [Pseudomonadota bacterium]